MKQGISRHNSQNHKVGGSPPTTPVVFPDLQRFAKHASRTLVIRDLPYSCKNDHLRQFLEVEHGFQVECVHVCYDRKNQSLHYGYALFLSDEMAKDVLNKLQGQRMWGRDLRLQPFDPLTPSQTSISGVIHVFFRAQSAQLPLITEATLRQFLESFGDIEHLVIRHHDFDRHDNRQSGFGFVTFLDESVNSHVAQTVRARHHQQVTYDCSWSRRHDPGATQAPPSSTQSRTEVSSSVEPPKALTPTMNLSQSQMNSLSLSPMPQSPLQSWVSTTSGSGYSSHSTSRAGSFTGGVSVSSPVGTPSAALSTTVTVAAPMMAQNKAPVMTTPQTMADPSTTLYVSMPPPPPPAGTYYVNGHLSSPSPMYSFVAAPHGHHVQHHPSAGPMFFSSSSSSSGGGYAPPEAAAHGQLPPPPAPALSLPPQAMRMYPAPSPYPPQQQFQHHQQQQLQQQQLQQQQLQQQQLQQLQQQQHHQNQQHQQQQLHQNQQQNQQQQQHQQESGQQQPQYTTQHSPQQMYYTSQPHQHPQTSYVYPASFAAQQPGPMTMLSSSPPAYATMMPHLPPPPQSMMMIPSNMPMPQPSTAVYYTY